MFSVLPSRQVVSWEVIESWFNGRIVQIFYKNKTETKTKIVVIWRTNVNNAPETRNIF